MFKKTKSHGSHFFRRIGFGFIGISLILLFIVMYMALSRATIIVEPKEREVKAELLVTVGESELKNEDILGRIGSITLTREAVFTSSGTGVEVPGVASGHIMIYNKHSKDQPLIATTRFLSKDGVLFRLKKGVTVLAGRSIEAEVYADKEGKEGNIEQTDFTIPGLSESLQKKIYGKSESPMTGGVKTVVAVSQKDIEDALQNLRSTLLSEAGEKLQQSLNADRRFIGIAYKDIIKNKETDIKVGEEAENFKLKIELEVIGVAFSKKIQDQAAKTLSNMIASNSMLVSSNILELQPNIENYNLESKSASLKVALTGQTIISSKSDIFDREKLAGMTKEETISYLDKYGIKSVEIKFFPFWMKKIPKLRDHIKVIVKSI